MDDMKIEDQIFYFKEGVVGDVENERSIAIRIIDALQAENKRYREALDYSYVFINTIWNCSGEKLIIDECKRFMREKH
jgi:hypothetical protein